MQIEDTQRLSEQIQAILQDNTARGGLSVVVSSSKGSFYFGPGYADIIKKQSVRQDHLFGIGSITKVFVAVVVFQLIEEGKLSLSDQVSKYLPEEITHDIEDASTASIRELLHHTSGIDSWEDNPDWLRHGRGDLVKTDHIWTKTEPLDYIRRPRRTSKPRGTWSYANTNYTLLGLIIEKITKTTAESEIRRRILQPLHMQHTFLEGFEIVDGTVTGRYHLATAEFRKNAGICPEFIEIEPDLIEARNYNLSTSWLAGGMVSSAEDLQIFASALRNGKLLKPDSTSQMHQWIPTGGQGSEMGFGLFKMTYPDSGSWLGHSGGVLGFSAGLWWHEEHDCCVSILSNIGVVNAGKVTIGVVKIINDSAFLSTALKLVSSCS